MGHSTISPSQADRFFSCPGSVQAQAKIDEVQPSNKYGLEGNAIHDLAARCIIEDRDPSEFNGDCVEVKDSFGEIIEITIKDDAVFTIKMYMGVIDSVLREHDMTRKMLEVEQYFMVPEIDSKAKGTTDCALIAGDTLYVWDLKTGRGITVSPEENRQAMYYALRPYLDARLFINRIVIGIVQPRAKEGDYVKTWETTPQRLEDFMVELKGAIVKTREPNAPIVQGSWCKYCKATATCSRIQNTVVEQLQDVIPNFAKVFPKVRSLTPEQIGKAIPVLEIITQYLESLKGYGLSLAANGQDIPNYCLTRGRKQRRFINEIAVVQAFEDEFGDEIYAERKLRTPTQLEKLVGKEAMSSLVIVPEGDLKLAPTKDTTDYIKRSAEEAFKDVQID